MDSEYKSQPSEGFGLSNLALLAVIGILALLILLDGKLYNKPHQQQLIYPISDAQSVEVYFDDELLLGFTKADDLWRQSHPTKAPVQQQRVQVLLDTNKTSPRHYNVSDVPADEIFKDSFTLRIDSKEYQLGTTEPVGNLRYVKAADKVYLQPDKVLPILSAANNAFIDLGITDQVQHISVGETSLEHTEEWSNLMAVSVIAETASQTPGTEIKLTQNRQTSKLIARHSDAGYTLTTENGFQYLLDPQTAESLGLADLLPKNTSTKK